MGRGQASADGLLYGDGITLRRPEAEEDARETLKLPRAPGGFSPDRLGQWQHQAEKFSSENMDALISWIGQARGSLAGTAPGAEGEVKASREEIAEWIVRLRAGELEEDPDAQSLTNFLAAVLRHNSA